VEIQCEVCEMSLKCGKRLVIAILHNLGFRVVMGMFWCDPLEGLWVPFCASTSDRQRFRVEDLEVVSSSMLVSPSTLTLVTGFDKFQPLNSKFVNFHCNPNKFV
jgi:hypothetical protein